ncbi:MAG TPA: BBP7 family outer membrane beta-barrel protein [Pirellulales bacterium]|nr:BBP7 family outer membrane beta-barrel protein [Pirellulales bacterium]
MTGPVIAADEPNTSEPDSYDQAWSSDTTVAGEPESIAPNSNAPIYDPPDANDWNSGAVSSGAVGSGGGYSQGSCSSCTTSPGVASDFLGTYRFGGGNPAFNGPWYVSADAFLLHRSNGNANIPITMNSNTGNTILSAQNLTFTSRVGPRLMVGYAWSHTTAFEVSYFGLIDSRTQVGISGPDNLTLPGDLSSVATGFSGASQVNVSYSSLLNNAEFNVLRNTGSNPISWLYGFRYLGLNEHLDINSVSSTTANYAVMTRNNMFGIQGGGRWMFNYKNFSLEATGKLGILENATMQTQSVTDPGAAFLPRQASEKGANVSFLSEFGANAIYRLSEHWGLRFGYTFIWVDGLALAPNQLDYTFTTTSGTGLNHGGNVFLSAINLGVEFHW